MASAICKFTTQTTHVYIVAPRMSLPAVLPPLSKACSSIAFVEKKNIIMALMNPFSIQLNIRRQLKRTFWTPSWYSKGNCHIGNIYWSGMGTYQETSNETYISKSLYTYLTEIKNLKSHLLFLKCNNFPIWPLSNIHPTPKVQNLHSTQNAH